MELFSFIGGLGFATILADAAKSAAALVGTNGGQAFGRYVQSELLARMAGRFGPPENIEATKAVRRAQMAGLRHVLTAYRANLPAEAEKGAVWPLDFIAAALFPVAGV